MYNVADIDDDGQLVDDEEEEEEDDDDIIPHVTKSTLDKIASVKKLF